MLPQERVGVEGGHANSQAKKTSVHTHTHAIDCYRIRNFQQQYGFGLSQHVTINGIQGITLCYHVPFNLIQWWCHSNRVKVKMD